MPLNVRHPPPCTGTLQKTCKPWRNGPPHILGFGCPRQDQTPLLRPGRPLSCDCDSSMLAWSLFAALHSAPASPCRTRPLIECYGSRSLIKPRIDNGNRKLNLVSHGAKAIKPAWCADRAKSKHRSLISSGRRSSASANVASNIYDRSSPNIALSEHFVCGLAGVRCCWIAFCSLGTRHVYSTKHL